MKYDPVAVDLAKKHGHHLFVLEINGKHARKPSVSVSGTAGPKTIQRLYKLIEILTDDEKAQR